MRNKNNNQKHGSHLVDPSLWPIFTAFSIFVIVFDFIFLGVVTMACWWRDIVRQSNIGGPPYFVQKGLKLGMVTYIFYLIFLFFPISCCEASEPWQLGIQNSATPVTEGMPQIVWFLVGAFCAFILVRYWRRLTILLRLFRRILKRSLMARLFKRIPWDGIAVNVIFSLALLLGFFVLLGFKGTIFWSQSFFVYWGNEVHLYFHPGEFDYFGQSRLRWGPLPTMEEWLKNLKFITSYSVKAESSNDFYVWVWNPVFGWRIKPKALFYFWGFFVSIVVFTAGMVREGYKGEWAGVLFTFVACQVYYVGLIVEFKLLCLVAPIGIGVGGVLGVVLLFLENYIDKKR